MVDCQETAFSVRRAVFKWGDALELDERLKELMRNLGIAINDALSDSPGVGGAIESVREAGYDVFLVLEATIGVRRRAAVRDGKRKEPGDPTRETVQLKVNDQDMKFLKSLKIRVDDLDAQ
jgi:hypothetical protein